MHRVTDFPFTVQEIENAWIPLSDGTRLAARIWMPVDALRSPVPAVLEYLPYRKSDCTALADAQRHPYFAGHGYASVRVDLRGTGDSDGRLLGEYLKQEQDDALEVLAWLAEQPWCTGDVGMIGYSWGGFNGLQVAARRPSQLKAVITIASTDDRYLDDCHYMGGCLLGSDLLKWAASMLVYALQPPDPRVVGGRWREMWLGRLANGPELARDWVSHQWRDGFWEHGSVAQDYSAIQCPVLAVGGWADAYTNAVPRLLVNLDVPRRGLIGPWGHMMPYEGVPGPAIGFLQEAVRWWDRWLKGIDTAIMDEPLLRVWMQEYVTPATFHAARPGRWMAVESWPPPDIARLALPLALEGTFRGRQECGEAAGVWCANGYPDEIAGDQRPDDERSLCFTSEPLQAPLEVLGHPRVLLQLSADRPCALLAVRLEDVAPDGASLLVSWGMLNLTHRDGHEQPTPLEPGRSYHVEIESRVCGHRFAAGHRVRLAVSPTYWPHAWPSPAPATLTLSADGSSVLELPVRAGGGPAGGAALPAGGADAPGTAPGADSPFGPPEVAGDLSGRLSGQQPALNTRRREVRLDGGRHEILDREEHERTVAATGARYRELAVDSYVIVEDDPLSATVRCGRETSLVGPSVDWRVISTSEMTCDERLFHVREEYAAFEGETEVFRMSRAHSMPRRLV